MLARGCRAGGVWRASAVPSCSESGAPCKGKGVLERGRCPQNWSLRPSLATRLGTTTCLSGAARSIPAKARAPSDEQHRRSPCAGALLAGAGQSPRSTTSPRVPSPAGTPTAPVPSTAHHSSSQPATWIHPQRVPSPSQPVPEEPCAAPARTRCRWASANATGARTGARAVLISLPCAVAVEDAPLSVSACTGSEERPGPRRPPARCQRAAAPAPRPRPGWQEDRGAAHRAGPDPRERPRRSQAPAEMGCSADASGGAPSTAGLPTAQQKQLRTARQS